MSSPGNNVMFAVDAVLQNAVSSTGNGSSLNCGGAPSVLMQVTGTFVATVTFQGTVDGNWVAITAVNLGTLVSGTSTTTAGLYSVNTAGCDQVRATVTWSSGSSVTVTAKVVGVAGAMAITGVNVTQWNGSTVVTGGTAGSLGVGGLAAVAATAVGNPVQCGGVYNTSPATISNGQVGALQLDAHQNLMVDVFYWAGNTAVTGGVNGSVGVGGLAASGASVAGNPVLGGAEYLAWASLPAVSTGQAVQLIADAAGTLKTGTAPLGTPLYGTANGGAQANNVTLTIPSGAMGFLDGFDIDGLGATSGASISVTVTGLLGGTLTFSMPVVAGVTTPNPTFSKRFNPPLQASAVHTNIVVNVPSFGTGNTAASTNAYGHYV